MRAMSEGEGAAGEVEVFDCEKAEEELKRRWEESVAEGATVRRYKCDGETLVAKADDADKVSLAEKLVNAQEEAEKACASTLSGILQMAK